MSVNPCGNCPFRIEPRSYLTRSRAEEIASSLSRGGEFACHRTVDYSGEGRGRSTPDSTFCVGALALMENLGGAHQNQMVRIHDRMGILPALDEIDTSLVPESFEDWIDHVDAERSS